MPALLWSRLHDSLFYDGNRLHCVYNKESITSQLCVIKLAVKRETNRNCCSTDTSGCKRVTDQVKLEFQ